MCKPFFLNKCYALEIQIVSLKSNPDGIYAPGFSLVTRHYSLNAIKLDIKFYLDLDNDQ